MKKLNAIIALAAAIAACSPEEKLEFVPVPQSEPVTISLTIPEKGLTKVTMEQDTEDPDGVVKLYWDDFDYVVVKNAADESKAVTFTYTSGEGTTSATFTAMGGVSALAGATSYNIVLNSGMPADISSQSQYADAKTSRLGYSASLNGVNKYSSATFSQEWATANGGGTLSSSSVLRIRAQLPTAAIADQVQKVTIKATSPIFGGNDEVNVSISAPGVEGDGKVLTVYATLPVGDVVIPAGTEILFQFQVSSDATDKYTAYRRVDAESTLYGGKVNAFKIACPDIASFAGPEDDGTEAKPYLIGDRHQLDAMRTLLAAAGGTRIYFKMIDDVDLSAVSSWVPVSTEDNHPLELDGDGHTISNLTIDNTEGTYPQSGFFGYLWGYVHDLVFDNANVNGGAKNSGIVMGRSGASSHAADLSNVTVKNSSLTSSNNYVGGLSGYVKKSNFIRNCHVINTTVTGTAGNVNPSLVGGLVGDLTPNGSCSVRDCSAEGVTIAGGCTNTNRSGVGGLFGRISAGTVTIYRCHSTGTLTTANTNNVGGLVGFISAEGTTVGITNSYSTCSIPYSYTFIGGLVGQIGADVTVTIDHCYASGDLSLLNGYGGKGGLVGGILGTGVTIKRSIAWNGMIKSRANLYSSGAVVGCTHPNCVLTDNYRNPDMSFDFRGLWVPSASFDHADVNGTTTPLQRITDALNESVLIDGTAEEFAIEANQKYFGYHGKHLSAGTVVAADYANGWVATPDIPDASDPEAAGWSETPVDFATVLPGCTTKEIRAGVEWTTFHGTWEGDVRNINIIRTTLDEHNSLGLYHYYTDGDPRYYLDGKCEYVDALVGTNGPMQSSHFVRINDVVERGVPSSAPEDYKMNCAITIDEGNAVDIVKVDGNAGAAALPNSTVGCAGPLLVWKGNIQSYAEESSDEWMYNPNPRTAIGLSKDGSTVIQVTVDGRWTNTEASGKRAIGMSTALLSQLMKALGCYKAMNFDGGGGTAMWVYGEGGSNNIVNHPADNSPYNGGPNNWDATTLRACGNAVYVKSDLK